MSMDGKEYMMTQIQLIELGKKIESLKLVEFLACINNAKTMAPMLDPTTYMRAANNLDAIEGLAKAFLTVKTQFENVRSNVIRTTIAELQRQPQAAPVQGETPQ